MKRPQAAALRDRLFVLAALALCALLHQQPKTTPQNSTPELADFAHRVPLYATSPTELQLLPGIGPARAHKLYQYLTVHHVDSVWDLTGVPGIGPRTVQRLAPYVDLSPRGKPDDSPPPR